MSTAADPRHFQQLDAQIRAVWKRTQFLHLTAGTLAVLAMFMPSELKQQVCRINK